MIGCAGSERAATKTPAAAVEDAPKPAEPATVTLTPDVERSLKIRMAVVERREVPRAGTFAGEIVVPAGGASPVTAPVSGTLMVAPGRSPPVSGATVRRGESLVSIRPRPSGRDIIRAAQARTKLPTRDDSASAIVIRSPRDGVVRDARIADGLQVTGGAVLLEVVSVDVLWVRVPIYVSDATTIDRERPASVHGLPAVQGEGGPTRIVSPIIVPPPAEPPTASENYFYELRNGDGAFRPGQKVGVTLQLLGQPGPSAVVPWSAIVHDVKGETWV
jgi:hypothetical protein